MSKPLFPDDEITALGGVRHATRQLERRPFPIPMDGADGDVLTRNTSIERGFEWAAPDTGTPVLQSRAIYADAFQDFVTISGTWSVVNDTTAPSAYYRTSTGTTSYLEWRLWVPASVESPFLFNVGFGRGTDCGIFKIQVAREYSGGVSTYHDNYQTPLLCDTYFSSSDWRLANTFSGDFIIIRPRYADPALGNLSGGGWVTISSITYWDAGPGWYRLRVVNNGTKNASSSDFRLKIYSLKAWVLSPPQPA